MSANNKIFIDARDVVMGRLSSYSSKKALEGYEVFIVNIEHAVISGSKEHLFKRYKQRIDRGENVHGPFYPRTIIGIARRMIRGMLPYKTPRGSAAFKKIKVYEGIPKALEGSEFNKTLKTKKDFDHNKYITLQRLSKQLGAKA